MTYLLGTSILRGNNEEVFNASIKDYLEANAGAKYIPQGRFVTHQGATDEDGMLLATSWETVVGISGLIPYAPCSQSYRQAVVYKSLAVAVEFVDTAGSGAINDPVYVTAEGKATLVPPAGATSIGYLLHPVIDGCIDQYGNETTGALIRFNGSVPVPSGAVVASANKSKKDEESSKKTIGGTN